MKFRDALKRVRRFTMSAGIVYDLDERTPEDMFIAAALDDDVAVFGNEIRYTDDGMIFARVVEWREPGRAITDIHVTRVAIVEEPPHGHKMHARRTFAESYEEIVQARHETLRRGVPDDDGEAAE